MNEPVAVMQLTPQFPYESPILSLENTQWEIITGNHAINFLPNCKSYYNYYVYVFRI